MVIDVPSDELPKDVTLIIFGQYKARVAARFFIDELKRKGYMTKHSVSDFASRLDNGEFIWHNGKFKYARKNFYAVVLRRFTRLGCITYESDYYRGKLVEGYWLDLGGFLKLVKRIGERWKNEFPQETSSKT
jgi:hypothetical protein